MRSAEDDAPDGRAAHSCSFVGSQLIVIGGYVQDIDDCDDDPVSILDVERMEWLEQYDSCESGNLLCVVWLRTIQNPQLLLPTNRLMRFCPTSLALSAEMAHQKVVLDATHMNQQTALLAIHDQKQRQLALPRQVPPRPALAPVYQSAEPVKAM